MLRAIRQETVVQPGGVVELQSSELEPGTSVEVIVIPQDLDGLQKHSLASLIGAAKGCYPTPEEADAFIRRERETWE